jgi:orotidine-5'-phosphate decarboxylase
MDPKSRIIVALDGLKLEEACSAIEELSPYVGLFKVGFELITRQQARLVAEFAANHGVGVFYDGKFHDIPQTVENAATVIAGMSSVTMFNVHCLGGHKMMEAAKEAAVQNAVDGKGPSVIGVTILTSHDLPSLRDIKLDLNHPIMKRRGEHETDEEIMRRIVVSYACDAKAAGLDGVVASPREVKAIREECGPGFLIVTPGVRPKGTALNDQKRVMTPKEAALAGADYLVIGRPILSPETGTRIDAAKRIAEEIYLAGMSDSIPGGQASSL